VGLPSLPPLVSVVRTASGHRLLRPHEPNCPLHPLLQGGGGRVAATAAATAADAAPATAADLANWATRKCCVVGGCTTTHRGAVTPRTLPAHLPRSHTLAAVPEEWVRALRLAGCRYCGRPYRTVVGRQRRTSLSRHEARCDERPALATEEDKDLPPAPDGEAGGAVANVKDGARPAAVAAAGNRTGGDQGLSWIYPRGLYPCIISVSTSDTSRGRISKMHHEKRRRGYIYPFRRKLRDYIGSVSQI